MPKMLVVGASGLVGSSAVRHFSALDGWDVIGVSRRTLPDAGRARLTSLDLTDAAACEQFFSNERDVTHLIYTAIYERPDLRPGWSRADDEYLRRNVAMLRNVLEPLTAGAHRLEHVSLLQGTKAYGVHHGIAPRVPLRERQPLVVHEDNFYFHQQRYLQEKRDAAGDWAWTIWRPEMIVGDALGSNLSILPAIGVYAALLRERGEPLGYPGNPDWWEVRGVIDTELFARAFEWAASSPRARDEIFNIGNGDVFVWQELWPLIAEMLGMEPGEDRPQRLAETMPPAEAEWRAIHARHALRGPAGFDELLGYGFPFTDYALGHGRPPGWRVMISDTTKLRLHGFTEVVDTEEMFAKWFERLEAQGVLPPAGVQGPRLRAWNYRAGTGQRTAEPVA